MKNITPYKNNAKIHTDKQLELLAKVVAEVGWRQNVEVNQKGVIVAGHGRYMAWEKYGEKYGLPEPWVTDDTGKTLMGEHATFPLTEQQEKMWRLADNQLNAMTGLDMDLVIPELKELDASMFELTGFDHDLILDPDGKDDAAPHIPYEPRSRIGDVIQLGRHRLVCGDSTKKEDVVTLMGGVQADMVFTDPPYNVDYSGRGKDTSNKILNDKMTPEQFDVFLAETFKRYAEVSKGGAGWYVFHSSSTQHQFQRAIESAGWDVKNQIIWNKPVASMGWGDYRWKHEPMFYCGKENTQFYGDRTNTTVLNIPEDDEKAVKWLRKQKELEQMGYTTIWSMKRDSVSGYVHPTQKPVELITYAIHNSSKEGDIVLDLFGGSGSTLIACEKTGRTAYLMELDPRYTDVIIKRYIDFVGNNCVTINDMEVLWE